MSIIACDHCGGFIDSDADAACFIHAPTCIPHNSHLDEVMCEPCRERAWDRQQEKAAEDAT
jgi:hypothetical protein